MPMLEMFKNQTMKYISIAIAVVSFLIFLYLLKLGEGFIMSLIIGSLICGLSLFKLKSYYEKNNPFVQAEHLAWLYGELQEYDPDLFNTISGHTKSSGRLELSQLKAIRNRYASSMTETQLQALASQHTEESKFRLDQYNYSIYVMDEVISHY